MEENIAIRRILGVEKKRRIQASVQLEEEYHAALVRGELDKSDLINISVQRLTGRYGYPLFLISLTPEGVRVQSLDKSDRINIAVGEMLREKGIV